MNKFETIILEHFKTVPKGLTQAIDAIRCELSIHHDYEPWFLHWRLERMVDKVLIRRGEPMASMFVSYHGTPTYGQVKSFNSKPEERE